MEAAEVLSPMNIEVELIDVQSLLPFDTAGEISERLKKTNRVVFMDEDVPGGASAYMMQQVLEVQSGYLHLDSAPRTLCLPRHTGRHMDRWRLLLQAFGRRPRRTLHGHDARGRPDELSALEVMHRNLVAGLLEALEWSFGKDVHRQGTRTALPQEPALGKEGQGVHF